MGKRENQMASRSVRHGMGVGPGVGERDNGEQYMENTIWGWAEKRG